MTGSGHAAAALAPESTEVRNEAERSGLRLSSLPGNSAKIRLMLDLARQIAGAERTRILDVGAGGRYHPFNVWEAFLPYADRIDLVGVDVAHLDNTAARAAELGFPVELRLGGVETIASQFGAASFDAVVSTQVLEHLPRWRAGVKAMCSVLKPGGLLYVTCDSGDKTMSMSNRVRLEAKCAFARIAHRLPALTRVTGLSGDWEKAPRRRELHECAARLGLDVQVLRHYGRRDLKARQDELDAAGRLAWLTLEEREHVDDPSEYLLLYLRAGH